MQTKTKYFAKRCCCKVWYQGTITLPSSYHNLNLQILLRILYRPVFLLRWVASHTGILPVQAAMMYAENRFSYAILHRPRPHYVLVFYELSSLLVLGYANPLNKFSLELLKSFGSLWITYIVSLLGCVR
ncbi:hypothetical protein J6590_067201 [Homalodisca vitripennis]|nr:hypothetical protein J6590_067201 [Homalodisca vitripennis]